MTDDRPSADFPNRPDHPDFRRLAAIARALDSRAEEEGFDLREHLAQYLDPESVLYVAQQRALRIHTDADVLAARWAAWLDGLVMGMEMAREARVFDGQRRRARKS